MAFYEDGLRQQVYRILQHAAGQVAANAYREQKRKNRGKHPRQFNCPSEVAHWAHLSGRLHKMTDEEVEALGAAVSSPINLERRFTPGAADKI